MNNIIKYEIYRRKYPLNKTVITEVRLVTSEKTKIVTYNEALRLASLEGLDLVIIDPKSTPPVAKIMDEGKYRYEISKRQKMLQKQQREKQVRQKEIQLRPVTGDNDIAIKAKNICEFLSDGNTVKISVRFRGREHSHVDMGETVINKILEKLTKFKITHDTRGSGKEVTVIVAPNADD